jgi:hypothetical protein
VDKLRRLTFEELLAGEIKQVSILNEVDFVVPIWVAELGGWNGLGRLGVTLKPMPDCEFDFNVTPSRPTAYQTNYAKRALGNACYELRHCGEGRRDHLLNVLAYKMGRLIARGWITRERVESYLLKSCEACGLLTDDGLQQCRDTIDSGIRAGMKMPYHDIGVRRLAELEG